MEEPRRDGPRVTIDGTPAGTRPDPARAGTVAIEGVLQSSPVDPSRAATLRPDVFNAGYCSVFDAVLQVCRRRGLPVQHHFAPDLGTHVIDDIGGLKDWWYAACYDGGHRCEEPAFRMDTHPYKDHMTIELRRTRPERLDALRTAWRQEVDRLGRNGGQVLVPEVRIQAADLDLSFSDVCVTPHNLRRDMLRRGVLTVADVMLSLADQGRLSLALRWVERTGACLDQSYYFTRFDGVAAIGRAGFTYSAGDRCFLQEGRGGFRDNRIHISSDIRTILSPQYVHWRWTDLSGRCGRTSRPGVAVAMGHCAEREA